MNMSGKQARGHDTSGKQNTTYGNDVWIKKRSQANNSACEAPAAVAEQFSNDVKGRAKFNSNLNTPVVKK